MLTVGLGAVASTLIAGVELVKKGQGLPIGSLTQMGTIRLGKRTEGRTPLVKDFVPLARLEDIVWGAWDVYPDDAYVAASRAGVRGSRRAAVGPGTPSREFSVTSSQQPVQRLHRASPVFCAWAGTTSHRNANPKAMVLIGSPR